VSTGSNIADWGLENSDDAMTKNTQLLIGLIVLCVVDAVVPFFPVLGLVLIYVLLENPPWFLETVRQVYDI